jgi:hypothetical protein
MRIHSLSLPPLHFLRVMFPPLHLAARLSPDGSTLSSVLPTGGTLSARASSVRVARRRIAVLAPPRALQSLISSPMGAAPLPVGLPATPQRAAASGAVGRALLAPGATHSVPYVPGDLWLGCCDVDGTPVEVAVSVTAGAPPTGPSSSRLPRPPRPPAPTNGAALSAAIACSVAQEIVVVVGRSADASVAAFVRALQAVVGGSAAAPTSFERTPSSLTLLAAPESDAVNGRGSVFGRAHVVGVGGFSTLRQSGLFSATQTARTLEEGVRASAEGAGRDDLAKHWFGSVSMWSVVEWAVRGGSVGSASWPDVLLGALAGAALEAGVADATEAVQRSDLEPQHAWGRGAAWNHEPSRPRFDSRRPPLCAAASPAAQGRSRLSGTPATPLERRRATRHRPAASELPSRLQAS